MLSEGTQQFLTHSNPSVKIFVVIINITLFIIIIIIPGLKCEGFPGRQDNKIEPLFLECQFY